MGTTLFGKDVKFSQMFSLLEGLNIDDEKDINILLLGESGIGKSTFVNALANYLSYKNLKDAEDGKLIVLIPTKFSVIDKNYETHWIETNVGSDDNEHLEIGSSATQDVKTYVFPIGSGKTKLRIIDSPGIGDTRGLEQDRLNCERILAYLGRLEQLHGICCMFSTNNSRIDAFFDYCLKEILSRLHTSASSNLIFIFTNSRAAHFTPGETLGILRKIAEDIEKNPPNIKIPLEAKNMFCFENDNFKYLAAKEKNVEFEDSERKTYNKSWKQSSKECMRMIHYIVGDGSTKPLPPHDIQNTVSINEARRLIVNLSMPLADISQLIQDNIYALDHHQQVLQSHSLSMDEMKKNLCIPVVDLEVTKVSQPATVCAASKCSEMYPVGSLQKWHYKQRCHEPCYLTNVPGETVGAPELRQCAAMDATKKCQKCSCDFSVHMHVYYFTKTKDSTIEDKAIKNSLLSREEAVKNVKRFIDMSETRRKEFENERRDVTKYMAQFAHFLQNNAIIRYNDAYEKYIKYMIEREKSSGVSDLKNIRQFEQLIQQYREAKASFDEALKFCKQHGLKDEVVTPDMIKKSIENLYNLPHTGKKIKELVMCQVHAQSAEYKQTEYRHNHPSNIFSGINNANSRESTGNKPLTEIRDRRTYANSKGNQNYKSGHNSNHNTNRQAFSPQDRALPPPYGSLYPHPHGSIMHGPNQAYNQEPRSNQYPYGQQGIKIHVKQNFPPACGDLNCRDPACAGNTRRGCANPNCTDPYCNYLPMGNPHNYSPMNNPSGGQPNRYPPMNNPSGAQPKRYPPRNTPSVGQPNCEKFPDCKLGDNCPYRHPACKFFNLCTRKNCPYKHGVAAKPPPATKTASIHCRFFPKCTKKDCPFFHPNPT